jgi:hypothetical protein
VSEPREYVGIVDFRTEADGLRAVRRVRLRQPRVLLGPVLLAGSGLALALVGDSALPGVVGLILAVVAVPSVLGIDRATHAQVTAPVVVRHRVHDTHLERVWEERRQAQLLPWSSVDRVHVVPEGVVLEVSRMLLPLPAELFPPEEGRALRRLLDGRADPMPEPDVPWESEAVVPPGPRSVGGALLRSLRHPGTVLALCLVVAGFAAAARLVGWRVVPVVGGSLLLLVGLVVWRLWCVAVVPAPPGARYRQGLQGDLLVIASPWQVDVFPVEGVREWLHHDDHLTLRGEGLELTVPAALFPYATGEPGGPLDPGSA